jgi:hypothetical protein
MMISWRWFYRATSVVFGIAPAANSWKILTTLEGNAYVEGETCKKPSPSSFAFDAFALQELLQTLRCHVFVRIGKWRLM